MNSTIAGIGARSITCLALTGALAAAGAGIATAAPAPTSAPHASPKQDSTINFTVTNNSTYTFELTSVSGKISKPATDTLTSAPTTFGLTDDWHPTDQGDAYYNVDDSTGTQVGTVDITFIDGGWNGVNSRVKFTGIDGSELSAVGQGTQNLTLDNGSCAPGYSHGAFSIDETIWNNTGSTMTLNTSDQLTNSLGGQWVSAPQPTLANGACEEITGYSNDFLMGFELDATYTLPNGDYVPLSTTVAPTTADGGGIMINSRVFSDQPVQSSTQWLGTAATDQTITSTDTTGSDNIHATLTVQPNPQTISQQPPKHQPHHHRRHHRAP